MKSLESYWAALPHRDDLQEFRPDQSRAFLDLLIWIALADGEVTAMERLGFAQAILNLPPFELDDWTIFERREGLALLGEVRDRWVESPEQFLDDAASKFSSRESREFVFAAVMRFVTPDGWDSREEEWGARLAEVFEIGSNRAAQLIQQAKQTEEI